MPLSDALYSSTFIFMPVLACFLFTGGKSLIFDKGVSVGTLASVYPLTTCGHVQDILDLA